MRENNTFNFDLNHPAALLFYHSSLLHDPKREIKLSLIGKTPEFINDVPYEKTKAQRILAKTMPTSSSHQLNEGNPEIIPVSTIIPVKT